MKHCTCVRCSHKWIQRRSTLPERCPSCQSFSWMKPITESTPGPKKNNPEHARETLAAILAYLEKNGGKITKAGELTLPSGSQGYINPQGYQMGRVTIAGKSKTFLVHRLVWSYFNSPIASGSIIHHKDRDKLNNALANLECLPRREHGARHKKPPKVDTLPPVRPVFDGEPLYSHTCLRCGHQWESRTETPGRCPVIPCNSPYWNKPRAKPKGPESQLDIFGA